MGRLAGRHAVVTGSAQGIGEAIARRLVAEGAAVVIADIDEAESERTVRAIREAGGSAQSIRADIGDENSVKSLAAFAERQGGCEILVNNAAILDMTSIHDMTMARYRQVLDINLDGAVRVTLALLPVMKKSGPERRILNIASILGLRGQRECIPYATAKGGIANFTRALACDVAADGITVNAIAPGFIDTRMATLPDGSGHEHDTDWFKDIYLRYGRILVGRAGRPEDIAGPAFFLCSDDSRYVTGQILLVDGGVSATF